VLGSDATVVDKKDGFTVIGDSSLAEQRDIVLSALEEQRQIVFDAIRGDACGPFMVQRYAEPNFRQRDVLLQMAADTYPTDQKLAAEYLFLARLEEKYQRAMAAAQQLVQDAIIIYGSDPIIPDAIYIAAQMQRGVLSTKAAMEYNNALPLKWWICASNTGATEHNGCDQYLPGQPARRQHGHALGRHGGGRIPALSAL